MRPPARMKSGIASSGKLDDPEKRVSGTTESDGYASELLRNYLSGEAAPGIEIELDLVRQFLPTITAQEIGTLARELFTDRNRVVIATAPERAGLVAVTEPALSDALAAASRDPGDWGHSPQAVERRRGMAQAD